MNTMLVYESASELAILKVSVNGTLRLLNTPEALILLNLIPVSKSALLRYRSVLSPVNTFDFSAVESTADDSGANDKRRSVRNLFIIVFVKSVLFSGGCKIVPFSVVSREPDTGGTRFSAASRQPNNGGMQIAKAESK